MNIAVLDDLPEDLHRLCDLLESVCAEHTPRPVIHAFTDDKKFLAHMSSARADIVFLDIYLGERTGIQTAQILRSFNTNCAIIFVTTSRDHAVEAFDVTAAHYLIKPVTEAGVREALARTPFFKKECPTIPLTIEYTEQRIPIEHIRYVDADGRRCSFHLTDGTTLSPYMTLSRAQELLDAMPMFLSCHRSLLVNMDEIHQLTPDGILLSDGTLLPIATRRKGEVERIYRAYMLKKMRAAFTP